MSELSPEARALLDAARDADEPTAADRDRIGRALAVPLGIAALAPAAAQATSLTAAGLLTAKSVSLVAALVLSVGGGAVALHHVRSTRAHHVRTHAVSAAHVARTPVVLPSAPAIPTMVETPPAPANPVALAVPTAPVVPALAAESALSARVATVHAGRHHHASADSLSQENALLQEAHRAVHRGDGAGALEILSTYGARFHHGELREERDVVRILALCSLGRREEARASAALFLRAHPGSLLTHRVNGPCLQPEHEASR